MNIGIVGHGKDKFTPETEAKAKAEIVEIFRYYIAMYGRSNVKLVSGHSPHGGIDIWAESIAKDCEVYDPDMIKAPKTLSWSGPYGYRKRNIDIARSSDVVYCIVVREYPPEYVGMRFPECYHCRKAGRPTDHVKSGGCYTLNQAVALGKRGVIVVIDQ